MKSSGWVVVIFENEHRQFDGEIAYVVGPFSTYEAAQDFAESDKHCQDGEFQLTFLDPAPASKCEAA